MTRPIILILVGCYLPGYKSGGPVQSIANMVQQLGDQFDFRIVTTDRDMSDAESYPNVEVDAWNTVGKASVYYMRPGARSIWAFGRLMRETPHDVLYANSFFSPVFTLRPLMARLLGLPPRRPMIIAPRGEFSKGAVALKAWKKRPYITLGRALGLYSGVTWHASSEYEAEDIRREMGSAGKGIVVGRPIAVAPDPASPLVSDVRSPQVPPVDRPLRVVFLSRIARKKNLDFALRVLSSVSAPVELSIYGVIEDEAYWHQCETLIGNLAPHIVVTYKGAVPHDLVGEVLSGHDLFLFPTRGENYGHVIHEALSAGLPVLLSDQTPWRELDDAGVGWDLSLDEPGAFAAVIESYANLTPGQRASKGIQAKAFAARMSADSDAVVRTAEMFRECARHSKRTV